MNYWSGRLGCWLAVSVGIAACCPALAMQPAETAGGFQGGAELGITAIGDSPKFAGAGDLSYGGKTGWFQHDYTTIGVDVISVGARPILGASAADLRTTLTTLGIRQPLPYHGPVAFAVEGGASFLNASLSSGNAQQVSSTTSGFVGVHATSSTSNSIAVTGMFRYHFTPGGIWQAGIGVGGPLSTDKRFGWQADYYHLGGNSSISSVNINSNTLMVGLRWASQ